jgi:hypothetical protein
MRCSDTESGPHDDDAEDTEGTAEDTAEDSEGTVLSLYIVVVGVGDDDDDDDDDDDGGGDTIGILGVVSISAFSC